MRKRFAIGSALLCIGAAAAAALMFAAQGRDGAVHRAYAPAHSFGLPPLELPADVVVSPDRVELGRKLFFDRQRN